ncbi:MAG: metal ABC transporter ATP-binding protein [Planctomycetota bacterium]|nr:MAG: metal ABC transporter ATP-binding protein [Planctomycetota bacterium]
MSERAAIRIRGLEVVLGGRVILEGVDLDVPEGSITALIGPNGAGKSTLLKAILGLVPYRGSIEMRGPREGRKPRLGYIPQALSIERENPIRMSDFLLLSSQRRPLWLGVGRARRRAVLEALERTGAHRLADHPIGKLSGGELQRVLLAKIVLERPDIVLMDEPASGIDIAGEAMFCGLVQELHDETGFTLVLVSHELSVVSHHATYVVCLNRRVKCSGAALETLTPENLRELYGPQVGLVRHQEEFKEGMHCSRL